MEFRAGNGISDCIQKQLNLSLKKNKSVEDQINGAVKRTLLSDCHIEFVPSKKQSSFKLHELKSKYTVLKPSASVIQADQVKNEVQLVKTQTTTPVSNSPRNIQHNIQLQWSSVRDIGLGLSNLGNTCFLNSTLQCLTYTPPLSNYLLSNQHSVKCQVAGICMLCELERHVLRSFSRHEKFYAPTGIAHKLRFICRHMRLGSQEDAHEFLRYLIDALQKSCLGNGTKNDIAKQQATVISAIFGGTLRSRVTCLSCKHHSEKFDPFLDISLDIKNASSINQALERFVQPEHLGGENAYFCSHCQQKVSAKKQFALHVLPNILTLHLKRFSGSQFYSKLTKHIQFPQNLDLQSLMTDKMKESPKYSLYAVLVHHGSSTRSGHYFAYVKASSNMWYCMNDSSVTPTSVERVLGSEAYLLFYVKKQSNNTPIGRQLACGAAEQKNDKLSLHHSANSVLSSKLTSPAKINGLNATGSSTASPKIINQERNSKLCASNKEKTLTENSSVNGTFPQGALQITNKASGNSSETKRRVELTTVKTFDNVAITGNETKLLDKFSPVKDLLIKQRSTISPNEKYQIVNGGLSSHANSSICVDEDYPVCTKNLYTTDQSEAKSYSNKISVAKDEKIFAPTPTNNDHTAPSSCNTSNTMNMSLNKINLLNTSQSGNSIVPSSDKHGITTCKIVTSNIETTEMKTKENGAVIQSNGHKLIADLTKLKRKLPSDTTSLKQDVERQHRLVTHLSDVNATMKWHVVPSPPVAKQQLVPDNANDNIATTSWDICTNLLDSKFVKRRKEVDNNKDASTIIAKETAVNAKELVKGKSVNGEKLEKKMPSDESETIKQMQSKYITFQKDKKSSAIESSLVQKNSIIFGDHVSITQNKKYNIVNNAIHVNGDEYAFVLNGEVSDCSEGVRDLKTNNKPCRAKSTNEPPITKLNNEPSINKPSNGLSVLKSHVTEKIWDEAVEDGFKRKSPLNAKKVLWDGSFQHRNFSLSELQSTSLHSLGSQVMTWEGNESEINRAAKEEWKKERKRSYSQRYNDELDTGKVKKVKRLHMQQTNSSHSNPFEEIQKQKSERMNEFRKIIGISE